MRPPNKKLLELAARVPTKNLPIGNKEFARVAIVGDAGYKGVVQDAVIFMMRNVHEKKPFDLIVHLGDVYSAAGHKEMSENLQLPTPLPRAANSESMARWTAVICSN